MPKGLPPQHQDRQPGRRSRMRPVPESDGRAYRGSGKLEGRRAVVTGGDSGIGRATAIAFAKEGADVAIVYYDEHEDAESARRLVEAEGRRCVSIAGDLGEEDFCREVVDKVVRAFGGIDVLVNNAGEQHVVADFAEVTAAQVERTFRTNIFSMFFLTRAALPHMPEGAAIVNSTSVTAYRGSPHLIDYAATKGAIVAFTRSLSNNLAPKGIRVNAVAPGPVWTPLIPASFPAEHVESFGSHEPLGRPAQPGEIAPCYVFLACDDSSYMTGQVLHPNGGEVVGG